MGRYFWKYSKSDLTIFSDLIFLDISILLALESFLPVILFLSQSYVFRSDILTFFFWEGFFQFFCFPLKRLIKLCLPIFSFFFFSYDFFQNRKIIFIHLLSFSKNLSLHLTFEPSNKSFENLPWNDLSQKINFCPTCASSVLWIFFSGQVFFSFSSFGFFDWILSSTNQQKVQKK